MKSNIITLRQRAQEKKKTLRSLLDKAGEEDRGLNEAEAAKYDEELKALVDIEKNIDREQALLDRERETAPIDDPNARAAGAAGAPGRETGFKSLGEQLMAVKNHETSKGRESDPRLFAAAGGSEAVPSDGGFLVQKDFSSELLTRMYKTGEIAGRCRRVPIGPNANGVKINAVDEDSRVDGSRWGGVLAYWQNEAGTPASTKPKFRRVELQLNKLLAICYATEELMEDANALEAVISQAFTEEMTFKTEEGIFNGTGSGQPLGLTTSLALITQARDAGDSGVTISTKDILAMFSRLWAPSRRNAVWYIDQSVEPLLYQLTVGSGSLAQVLLYTPPGKDGNGYGSMLGCPVIIHEHGQQLGTPGDVVLADMTQYVLIDKGGVRQDYSIHVNFLSDEGVFRFAYRVDGQTWWKKPLTPKSGGPTQSPFIQLATRS